MMSSAPAALVFLAAVLTGAEPSGGDLDCERDRCVEVLPGAAAFRPVANAPYVEALGDDGGVIGWLARSDDVVDVVGYSAQPLITLVGLDKDARITGARVLSHSEPILLVGIPESALTEFTQRYAGVPATAQVTVGASSEPGAVVVDVVSGATVTVLAENRTILETARAVGAAVGVLEGVSTVPGHFIEEDRALSWEEMVDDEMFGRLTVEMSELGQATSDDDEPFIDLWFTLADAPQVGRSLLGEGEYRYLKSQLAEGEHLLVVMGSGRGSFKGSGFVRGGLFDRIRVEQGIVSALFRDVDYHNVRAIEADGAPSFKEAAVFVVRKGKLDPGRPFDLVLLASRYDGKGGFSREFHSFRSTLRLPRAVYQLDGPDPSAAVWRQAWRLKRVDVAVASLLWLLVIGLFVARRWLTGSMARLKLIHTAFMVAAVFGLGFWLKAQPSVTQVLTLIHSVLEQWRWDLFLSEPLLVVSWIGILVVTLVWGRGVFCGWLCPYGALSELIRKTAARIGVPLFELPARVHRVVRLLRYGVLAGLVPAFLLSPAMGERLSEVEPFKTTFFVVPWTREWWLFAWWLLLLVASTFMWRPFCRYVCPLGAGLALLGSFRLSGPLRRDFCSRCRICTRGCEPRAIRSDGSIDPRECLSCMECEATYRDDDVCPPLVRLKRKSARRSAA